MTRAVWITAGILLALGTAFAAAVIYRNYAAVMYDFASTPSSEAARHIERATNPDLKEVSFKNRNGLPVAGWYSPSRNRAAVVITHGTNSDRASMLDETKILAAAGFGVLAMDWPGCGASAGTVKWGSDERDALKAALDWLAERQDVDPSRIGGLGFSMGAFVMTQVASMDPRLSAVILEASPPSFEEYTRWAHRKWGALSEFGATVGLKASGMATSEMRPIDVIPTIYPRKMLIIGGSMDTVVPEFMTRALHAAAGTSASLWIVQGAGHGGYLQASPAEYPERIIGFFTEQLLARPS